MKKYAHISQDACGILTIDDTEEWTGLFTDNIESCLIYVFECEKAAVMCHDSGQMSVKEIAEIVSKNGKVNHVHILHQTRKSSANEVHRRRLLSENLSFSVLDITQLTCSHKTFAAIYNKEQKLCAIKNEIPTVVESPSDIAYRWAVAKLNNAFIKKNSQNLPGNLQFDGEKYLPPLKPIDELKNIIKIIEVEPAFIFMNLSVILLAERDGVIELPEPIRAFAHSYRITPDGWPSLANQEAAYELFKKQNFANLF